MMLLLSISPDLSLFHHIVYPPPLPPPSPLPPLLLTPPPPPKTEPLNKTRLSAGRAWETLVL